MISFDVVYQHAKNQKGEDFNFTEHLPSSVSSDVLRARGDDRYLSDLTRCVFRAGFIWRIIDHKWPGFEDAFSGFIPRYWQQAPPERLDALASDPRVVRNRQKINTVPYNARMIVETSEAHNGFGHFLAAWPSCEQAELLLWLKKNGARLGGVTAQYFLRMQGWDGFILTPDVVFALNRYQLLDASPTSKKGLEQAQAAFNHWHQETKRPYSHLSRILSFTANVH